MAGNALLTKIIKPMLVTSFAITSVLIIGLYFLQQHNISTMSNEKFKDTLNYLTDKVMADIRVYESLLETIKHDKQALTLLKKQDSDGLYRHFKSLYQRLNYDLNTTHFYFHRVDKTNLVRLHNKNVRGDLIERVTLDRAEESKSNFSGVEFGISHNYTLRVVSPWLVDGELIGYIELGKELDYLIFEYAKLTNTEIIFTVNKRIFNERDKQHKQGKSKPDVVYEGLKNFYAIGSSLDVISDELAMLLDETENIHNEDVINQGRRYQLYSEEFLDVRREEVGKIVLLNDVTEEYQYFNHIVLVLSFLMVLLNVLFMLYSYRLVKQSEKVITTEIDTVTKLSVTDELSGLYNKRHFNAQMPDQIIRCQIDDNYISIIMIDIDNFKQYNDNYGHSAGDEVIKAVADVMLSTVKRNVDSCYRVGGEEFAIVLESSTEETANDIAIKLCNNVEHQEIPHAYSDASSYVTVSIGVCSTKATNITYIDDLYESADRALFTSKRAGKNQVSVFGRYKNPD